MPQLNGISIIPPQKWVGPNVLISTDACLEAIGGWSQGEFFHARLPTFILAQQLSINEIECIALMIALKKWGYKLTGHNVLFQCDNMATVWAVNRGRARNSYMQAVLREIAYFSAINDCLVRVVYLELTANRISDALSCFHLGRQYKEKFYKLTRGIVKRDKNCE